MHRFLMFASTARRPRRGFLTGAAAVAAATWLQRLPPASRANGEAGVRSRHPFGRPDDARIDELAGRIDGFSIAKDALLADDPAAFVARLHAAGYCVVAWTFADDRHDAQRFALPSAELAAALDAFFTDFPASGLAARERARPAE